METTLVKCRSRVHPSCYHGQPEAAVYPDGVAADDGTYDGDGTVICDPCYIVLGQPLKGEPSFVTGRPA